MKAEFSEFSYGFALSYEITNKLSSNIVGAPLFPSLIQEADVGYDVRFRAPSLMLFLQFKLADYLKTSLANYWSSYHAPYFRVAVHRLKYSKQHNLLKKLSLNHPFVFYVAPSFYRQSEFNQAFKQSCMIKQSVFFSLRDLPNLTDSEQHHLTFRSGQTGFHWHSEERHYFERDITGQHWIDTVLGANDMWDRGVDFGRLIELRDELARIVSLSELQISYEIDELINLNNDNLPIVIRDIRFLLVTYFGVEPILLRRTS